ncbi:MAG TPA: PASTA domain-containing protein [Pyrinomonadaceae bacterium]|nr:PASTA domain-containing protein [Pyrinomonadaceae bacterium]
MPNEFDITVVTDRLRTETGNATFSFTVKNKTSRPLRGIARIKPQGDTKAAWIKIEGETERDFPAGGTHKYNVNFSKPPAEPQPAESFQFRFDVVSSMNPDEDFTEGPIVTVEIPEQKVITGTPFKWWMVAAAAAVLLAVGGVILYLVLRNSTPEDKSVEVPDVIGKTFAEAVTELEGKGFTAVEKNEVLAANKPVDRVLQQNPPDGAKALTSDTITLTVPEATTVPPLKGMCAAEAVQALQKNQLVVGELSGDMEKIKNCERRVGTTEPQVNQPIAKGGSVKLNFLCDPKVEKCRVVSRQETIKDFLKASP